MKFIGLQKQIRQNNFKSILLLLSFPVIILGGTYVVFFLSYQPDIEYVNRSFIKTIPYVAIGVTVWFLIAYFSHSAIIKRTTKSQSLSRKENMKIYNMTENLCMSIGMTMPKLYIIDSPGFNAFASGLDNKTFSVTLTSGIIEHLTDEEIEGVIAHELTHIRNKDVRLLIISIIFVGIFGFLIQVMFRSMLFGGRRKDSKLDPKVMIIAFAVAALGYLLTMLFRFALSRKREYLADAGAVELTKNSHALASALRKISGNSDVEVKSADVKQMFIENGGRKKGFMSSMKNLFATHPPIDKRIEILERRL
tara:strand:+ start:6886 stop:7809 length:924 start_codon:yes stop_codon:yes gene_type:complete